jgi:hypothetical protein
MADSDIKMEFVAAPIISIFFAIAFVTEIAAGGDGLYNLLRSGHV